MLVTLVFKNSKTGDYVRHSNSINEENLAILIAYFDDLAEE